MAGTGDTCPDDTSHGPTQPPEYVQRGDKQWITFPAKSRKWYRNGQEISAPPAAVLNKIDFENPFIATSPQSVKVNVVYYRGMESMIGTFVRHESYTATVYDVTDPFDYGEIAINICLSDDDEAAADLSSLHLGSDTGGQDAQPYSPHDIYTKEK
jgi:hypothetical protein